MTRRQKAEFKSNGLALGYIRVSTDSQANGLMAQGERIARETEKLRLRFRSDIHHDSAKPPRPGHFTDAGESAFRTSTLASRTAGGALLDWAEPGDTIIMSKLDRGWRNVADFIATANELVDRGVGLVICDPPINLGTATGRMLARHLANLAEWESDRKSERIKEALAVKKAKNTPQTASVTNTVEWSDSDWRPDIANKNDAKKKEAGRILIYIRCSHRDSATSGLGLLQQAETAKNYAKWLIVDNAALELGDDFTDPVVSASSIDLRQRPAGKRLDSELQSGDHVVFATLDRGFRSIQDMANTIPDWIKRGVHIHFAAEGISIDDPGGKMLANVIVQFAEMEAQLTSDRTKEARAQLSARGRHCGGFDIPVFWKVEYENRQKHLVLDRRQVVAFRLVNFLRHHRGLTKRQSCARAEELFAAKENRRTIPEYGLSAHHAARSSLPPGYPRKEDGTAMPVITFNRYKTMVERAQTAMIAWRKRATELRTLKGES